MKKNSFLVLLVADIQVGIHSCKKQKQNRLQGNRKVHVAAKITSSALIVCLKSTDDVSPVTDRLLQYQTLINRRAKRCPSRTANVERYIQAGRHPPAVILYQTHEHTL